MKILYAEDEKHLSKVISAILTHNDYEVDSVYDGEEAYNAAKNNEYDVIILDIMMPKMSGTDIVRALRDDGDETPVILLTAKAELEDRINGLDSGADDYIVKPFAAEELLARIRAAVRANRKPEKTFKIGSADLNTEKLELKCGNSALHLNVYECEMLIMLSRGERLSLQSIFKKIWNDSGDPLIVRMYVNYLNKKLTSVNSGMIISDDDGYILKAEA